MIISDFLQWLIKQQCLLLLSDAQNKETSHNICPFCLIRLRLVISWKQGLGWSYLGRPLLDGGVQSRSLFIWPFVPSFHLKFLSWFNLRKGCANENASPNSSITGEDTPVPSFQLILIQAWPSPLPTPASIDLNLSRIVKRASNQPKD